MSLSIVLLLVTYVTLTESSFVPGCLGLHGESDFAALDESRPFPVCFCDTDLRNESRVSISCLYGSQLANLSEAFRKVDKAERLVGDVNVTY